VATEKHIHRIARLYVKRLAAHISVKQAILTGSWARGTHLEDSDVDLIVVSDDFSRMPLPDRLVYLQKDWKARVPLEAFGYTTSEFRRLRKNSSYVRDAVRHGISLVS
jgi:predicted nucleotidyltransferase